VSVAQSNQRSFASSRQAAKRHELPLRALLAVLQSGPYLISIATLKSHSLRKRL
jgi:hypothetical protein